MSRESSDAERTTSTASRQHNGDDRRSATRRRFLQSTATAGAVVTGFGVSAKRAASEAIRWLPTPRLRVEGNLLKDHEDNTVTLRGLTIADPKRLNVTAPARGKNASQTVRLLTDVNRDWYPSVIRVPARPTDIAEHESGRSDGPPAPVAFTEAELEDYLETHYDPVVEALKAHNCYAIVSFNRHWPPGFDRSEDDADGWNGRWAESEIGPVDEELQAEVERFWEVVADRYADEDHVLYEVYSEPTVPGMPGAVDRERVRNVWHTWTELAQPWIDTIREHADNVVIVGSPGRNRNPEGYYIEPFEGENLAYAYRISPNSPVSREEEWSEMGDRGHGVDGVYEEVPVFVTGIGWETNAAADELQGETLEFGAAFVDWLESHDALNWTAGMADPIRRPSLFGRPFVDEESAAAGDPIGNPYADEMPVRCEELPCEWELLGDDESAGEFVKYVLDDVSGHNMPAPETGRSSGPQDTTGDGLYNDFDGDGQTTHDDVTAFFETIDSDGVQNNPDAFDFDGDGSLGFGDVVNLLRRV